MAGMLKLASLQHIARQVMSCLASPEATFWQHSRAGITLQDLSWSGLYPFFFFSAHGTHNPGTYVQNQAAHHACTILSYLQKFLGSDFRSIVSSI